jgi:peptide/nickel transport system permease protein
MLKYLGKRLLFVIPQLFGVVLITFIMVRMIPGDPARIMAGPLVDKKGVELIRERMGLSGTLLQQFIKYISNILEGNLGNSWVTGNPVLYDIKMRLPATLQLVVLALIVSLFVMVPLGIKSITSTKGRVGNLIKKILTGYGMAAGAFPDFWLALILIFIFYVKLGIAPPPSGQIEMWLNMPKTVTGFSLIDSIFTGNFIAFLSLMKCHVLPVFVLAFVYGGGILKVALTSTSSIKKSEFINYLKINGLTSKYVQKYISRAAYPTIATFTAVNFGFMLGGTVLVESVFSWGGFGQYAVQSVINSDFTAIQGVVLISAVLNIIAYILVDFIYLYIDPRIKEIG